MDSLWHGISNESSSGNPLHILKPDTQRWQTILPVYYFRRPRWRVILIDSDSGKKVIFASLRQSLWKWNNRRGKPCAVCTSCKIHCHSVCHIKTSTRVTWMVAFGKSFSSCRTFIFVSLKVNLAYEERKETNSIGKNAYKNGFTTSRSHITIAIQY